jgi:proteic killer suppression protein
MQGLHGPRRNQIDSAKIARGDWGRRSGVPRLGGLRLKVRGLASKPEDMDVPGFAFHSLMGFNPTRYTVHVNGPWCITFAFANGDAEDVDFEQYH